MQHQQQHFSIENTVVITSRVRAVSQTEYCAITKVAIDTYLFGDRLPTPGGREYTSTETAVHFAAR